MTSRDSQITSPELPPKISFYTPNINMASPAVAIPNGVATGSSSSSPSLNHQVKNDVNVPVTTTMSSNDSAMAAENAQSFSSSSSSSSASASTNNTTSIKRKRETSLDEGHMQLDHHDTDPHHPGKSSATTAVNDDKTANGLTATKDLKSAIRDYFQVLER